MASYSRMGRKSLPRSRMQNSLSSETISLRLDLRISEIGTVKFLVVYRYGEFILELLIWVLKQMKLRFSC